MPSGQMGANNGHSASCRANQRTTRGDWGEQRLSRTPSIKSGLGEVVAPALVTSSNRRDSKKIEVPSNNNNNHNDNNNDNNNNNNDNNKNNDNDDLGAEQHKHRDTRQAWICSCPSPHQTGGDPH